MSPNGEYFANKQADPKKYGYSIGTKEAALARELKLIKSKNYSDSKKDELPQLKEKGKIKDL